MIRRLIVGCMIAVIGAGWLGVERADAASDSCYTDVPELHAVGGVGIPVNLVGGWSYGGTVTQTTSWGDGTSETDTISVVGTPPSESHVYTTAGTYDITLSGSGTILASNGISQVLVPCSSPPFVVDEWEILPPVPEHPTVALPQGVDFDPVSLGALPGTVEHDPAATLTAAGTASDSGGSIPWLAAGAVAIAGLLGLGWWLLRPRPPTPAATPAPGPPADPVDFVGSTDTSYALQKKIDGSGALDAAKGVASHLPGGNVGSGAEDFASGLHESDAQVQGAKAAWIAQRAAEYEKDYGMAPQDALNAANTEAEAHPGGWALQEGVGVAKSGAAAAYKQTVLSQVIDWFTQLTKPKPPGPP